MLAIIIGAILFLPFLSWFLFFLDQAAYKSDFNAGWQWAYSYSNLPVLKRYLYTKAVPDNFIKGAKAIENNPHLYSFDETRVGCENQKACMWGFIGRFIGMNPCSNSEQVALRFGMKSFNLYFYCGGQQVFNHPKTNDTYHDDAKVAANRMRAFADYRWPEDSL